MYYDEQKEDLHARVQDAKRSMGESMNSDNITKQNIRKLYQSKQHIQRYGSPSQRNYRIRLGHHIDYTLDDCLQTNLFQCA